jgi:hypothetical protein
MFSMSTSAETHVTARSFVTLRACPEYPEGMTSSDALRIQDSS